MTEMQNKRRGIVLPFPERRVRVRKSSARYHDNVIQFPLKLKPTTPKTRGDRKVAS